MNAISIPLPHHTIINIQGKLVLRTSVVWQGIINGFCMIYPRWRGSLRFPGPATVSELIRVSKFAERENIWILKSSESSFVLLVLLIFFERIELTRQIQGHFNQEPLSNRSFLPHGQRRKIVGTEVLMMVIWILWK